MPVAPRELVFLVNGRSRTGAQSAQEARSALEAEGFEVKGFEVTSSPSEFTRVLDAHLVKEEPLIAIGGGDGTQRMAAEKIAGTSSVMAVVPLGTGNAWAHDLGIPIGSSQSAKALATASVESIDLGVANGRGFVNVATIGLTALIAKNMSTGLKSRFGRLAYFPAVIRSITELRPFELHVTTDAGGYDGKALLFVAAAGRTHAGPFRVTRDSLNNDGRLSLYALDDTDRRGLALFGLALLTGLHTFLNEVWTCEATTVELSTRPPKRIIVDGEPSGKTPLSLSIKPNALRVLIPGQPSKTEGLAGQDVLASKPAQR